MSMHEYTLTNPDGEHPWDEIAEAKKAIAAMLG